MKADWVRLWHDMPSDPKWRTIARKSGQRVGDVIAVFSFMLTNASAATERGTLEGWDSEDVATALDLDAADVSAIVAAMQGKTLEGQRLTGWDKRQPKREDSTAAERQREKREREKQARDADDSHALSRAVTHGHDLEERREEREEKERKKWRSRTRMCGQHGFRLISLSRRIGGLGPLPIADGRAPTLTRRPRALRTSGTPRPGAMARNSIGWRRGATGAGTASARKAAQLGSVSRARDHSGC